MGLIEFDRLFDVAYFNGDVITAVDLHAHDLHSRDIRLLRVFRQRQQDVQQRALADGKAQPHRWAPDQRYVIAHCAPCTKPGFNNGANPHVSPVFCA